MTAEHFEATVDALMAIRPFKPFTIELNTGQRLVVDHPGGLVWKGAGIFKAPGGPLIMFDHVSVSLIVTTPSHPAP